MDSCSFFVQKIKAGQAWLRKEEKMDHKNKCTNSMNIHDSQTNLENINEDIF